jgi:putative SOS response-associated peptidase YedK
MCGLYSFRRSAEEVRGLFGFQDVAAFPPRQHIGPGGPIAVVKMERGRRIFALVRWGFIASWMKEIRPGRPLINARAESVLAKPSFRNAMKRRRCLLPADGFFQWKGDVPGKKQPFNIHRPGNQLFAIAGLWEPCMGADGSEIDTAVIITTPASPTLATIHDRMPAIIMPDEFALWLDCDRFNAQDAARLLVPPSDDYFVAEPVTLSRPSKNRTQAGKTTDRSAQLKLL